MFLLSHIVMARRGEKIDPPGLQYFKAPGRTEDPPDRATAANGTNVSSTVTTANCLPTSSECPSPLCHTTCNVTEEHCFPLELKHCRGGGMIFSPRVFLRSDPYTLVGGTISSPPRFRALRSLTSMWGDLLLPPWCVAFPAHHAALAARG